MQPFWDRVNKIMLKYEDQHNNGYMEIKAHDIIYRSLPPDHHGIIEWVSWEPFNAMAHFSWLTDPNATIKWREFNNEMP
jgi:hypothetical protein